MYFLVNYQLMGIQTGIQAGHAALRYAYKYFDKETFHDFMENWETWIVLNGGTTNSNPEYLGTMNQHLVTLTELGVNLTSFNERDLGDQLTAICFILDERVFNKKKYPDFRTYLTTTLLSENQVRRKIEEVYGYAANPDLSGLFPKEYSKWVEFVGGETNVKLREFISPFRLA